MRRHRHTLNGGLADAARAVAPRRMSYNVAETYNPSENNSANAWQVSRSSISNSNNNKQNANPFHSVAALGVWNAFYWSVLEAYFDCVRNKTARPQAMEYIPAASVDIPRLAQEIWSGSYKPSTSTCFMVTFPKLREVFAAAFRDRVVHHWICLRLVPVFEEYWRRMGNMSHACRRGFGNKTAVSQVANAMRRISGSYQRPAWIYRGDVVSFFMSLDKGIMLDRVLRIIEANRLRWPKYEYDILRYLVAITIGHLPHKDCVLNSPLGLWREIDPSKSMFYVPENKSMPIGNLTTQMFAGAYMMPAIKFIRERFEYYFGREWWRDVSFTISVDDFVFVCSDKRILKLLAREFVGYLRRFLLLECHAEKVYLQPVSHGVKFLGKWIKPGRVYIINRTAQRFLCRLREAAEACRGRASPDVLNFYRSSLNSYLGIMRGTRSHKIISRAFAEVDGCFYRYFEFTNGIVKIKKQTK